MRIFILIFLVPVVMFGQNLSRPLLKANSLFFKNHVYVYGFIQDKNELAFKLYRINAGMDQADSTIQNLGNEKIEDQLEIMADTLHGYLNFYLQKINSKNLASLLRYDEFLRLIAKTENFETTKINSLTTFENEIYSYKNSVYTIRSSEDSLGKQFYLNKFEVVSAQKPFEYKIAWQYPLEKRHINTTHVFYADTQLVMVYVTILSGEKKGQWILKINAGNGSIIKGIKLNEKGDERSYIFNAFNYDPSSGELFVTGNIYTKQQFDPESKTFGFTNLNKQNTFFFITINTDEVMAREERIIPVTFTASPGPKVAGKPQPNFYHIKIKELKKTSKTDYLAYCDIYKSIGPQLLFLYETGFILNISAGEMGYEIKAGKIFNSLSPFPNLVNTDLKDINGKIELKSIIDFDRFLYSKPISDVEKFFGIDDNKNSKWIISKNDMKTGTRSFYRVNIGIKGIENKLILEGSKYNHPDIYRVTNDKVILFNSDTVTFNLSLTNW